MKYVVVDDIQTMGASKSLYRTIEDIDRMIEGSSLDEAGPIRKKLRRKIRKAIYLLEERYYKLGYRRGVHTVCDMLQKKRKISGTVKKVIRVRFWAGDPEFSKRKAIILRAFSSRKQRQTRRVI